MFDTVCTFPLKAELFAQAVHPTASLVTVGLTSGHVAALRLPPAEGDGDGDGDDGDDADDDDASGGALNPGRRGSDGTGFIDTAWQTKRHKGSCRCLTYSLDGTHLFSAGTDGLVKAANSETGVVTGKLAIPQHPSSTSSPRKDPLDPPTVIHALSPQTLLLSTDSGALHLYDLRDPSSNLSISTKDPSLPFFPSPRPSQTYHPHTDFISSLTPLPASETSTSGFSKQWLTTGGTTLAVTDLRRGVLAKSADQEELLLSSTYVTGLSARRASTSTGEKAVIGGGDGVLTLWEKGQWDDQDERIIVSREGETLDCLVRIPDGIGGFGKRVAVGVGDGRVRFVRLGQNKIVGEVRHDEVEGVVALGFDQGGRMISGGGMVVKVWQEHIEGEEEEDEEETVGGVGKRAAGSEEDSDEESGDGSSDEDEAPRQRRKKRRKGKGPVGGNAKKFDFAGLD